MDASNSHHRQVDWYSGYKSVGVRNLNATHEKYLFRSLYTKKFLGLDPRNFFIQSEGLVWHQRACALYGIATKSRMASRKARIKARSPSD